MNLAEARAWRDEIRISDAAATVPTGYGPDRYFVQVWPREGVKRLTSSTECLDFMEQIARHRAEHERLVFRMEHPARSPLDRMIDEACRVSPSPSARASTDD